VKGFKAYSGNEASVLNYIISKFLKLSKLHGFKTVHLPLVEEVELYLRTSGEASDVCNKELFEVHRYGDKSRGWVLRPEGTAGCMQMVKEQSLMQDNHELRLAYHGPMFRYNRPQAGRYRQFSQLGWEYIGVSDYHSDFEVIKACVDFLKDLNIDFEIEINSICDSNDRKNYRKELKEFYNLDDSQDPLKVLDKAENFDNVPKMKINEKDRNHFEGLKVLLEKSGIKFTINPFLVRGLDYYNSTVFEFKSKLRESQGSLLGGGRYDYLMEQIGGKHTPAIGFSIGLERLLLEFNQEIENDLVVIASLDAPDFALKVADDLRKEGTACVIWKGTDLSKILKKAVSSKIKRVAIAGEKEEKAGKVVWKELSF